MKGGIVIKVIHLRHFLSKNKKRGGKGGKGGGKQMGLFFSAFILCIFFGILLFLGRFWGVTAGNIHNHHCSQSRESGAVPRCRCRPSYSQFPAG